MKFYTKTTYQVIKKIILSFIHCHQHADHMKRLKIEPSPYTPFGPKAIYRKDTLYVRFEPLETLSKFETLAFIMHEANPGHHLSNTWLAAQTNLPNFIKKPMFYR